MRIPVLLLYIAAALLNWRAHAACEFEFNAAHRLRVTQPSGALTRALQQQPVYEIDLDPTQVNLILPRVLPPFPNLNDSYQAWLKKKVLSETTVRLVRNNLTASLRAVDDLDPRGLVAKMGTERWNLVILGDRVVTVKLGASSSPMNFFTNRHLILAGYDGDVRFAGELYVGADGRVYVTRNSGTYRPSEQQLLDVVELLSLEFPELLFAADKRLTLY